MDSYQIGVALTVRKIEKALEKSAHLTSVSIQYYTIKHNSEQTNSIK